MTRVKCPDELGERVVREILEKERMIASVAASFRSGSADRGGRGSTRRRRGSAEAQDPEAAAESAEIAGPGAGNGELRAEKEFLKKAAALLAEERW